MGPEICITFHQDFAWLFSRPQHILNYPNIKSLYYGIIEMLEEVYPELKKKHSNVFS